MNDDEKIKVCNGLIYGRGRINERKMEYGIIDYDHIPETLWYYRIEKIQAKNMLLEMQGHYSIDMVNEIIQPIIRFLDQWEPDNEGSLTIETQNLVNVLDKFIKDATNITIDLEYSKVYSPIRLSNFNTEYLEPTAFQYNKFINALKKELKSSLNTDFIYADLESHLFPVIENYLTWYVNNKTCLDNSNIRHPYHLMLALFVRAFQDTAKYFPEKIKQIKIQKHKVEGDKKLTSIIPVQSINTLEDVTINDYAKENIYDILITAGLIDKDTKIVIDQESGNKGYFFSTILLFFEKGYYKRKPSQIEYLAICKNTFKIDISPGTAKNNKTRPASKLIVPPFISID